MILYVVMTQCNITHSRTMVQCVGVWCSACNKDGVDGCMYVWVGGVCVCMCA